MAQVFAQRAYVRELKGYQIKTTTHSHSIDSHTSACLYLHINFSYCVQMRLFLWLTSCIVICINKINDDKLSPKTTSSKLTHKKVLKTVMLIPSDTVSDERRASLDHTTVWCVCVSVCPNTSSVLNFNLCNFVYERKRKRRGLINFCCCYFLLTLRCGFHFIFLLCPLSCQKRYWVKCMSPGWVNADLE